jgi:hypothetical protein
MPDLAAYQRHLERFGPERVLETAAHDLPTTDLAQLKALVVSMERTARFTRGRWHQNAMAQERRQCPECGLDLPSTASSRMVRHRHCAKRATRRRYRAERAQIAHEDTGTAAQRNT